MLNIPLNIHEGLPLQLGVTKSNHTLFNCGTVLDVNTLL